MVTALPKALSSQEKWRTHFHWEFKELCELPVNNIPYSILKQISPLIKTDWNTLDDSFFTWINENPTLSINTLLELVDKVNTSPITKLIFQAHPLSLERQRADKDPSKGWMVDLSSETLAQLLKLFENGDWRLLADALGFNYLQCKTFHSPSQVFEMWIDQNPLASVARLDFEASELRMNRICLFLEKIPLKGPSKTTPSSRCNLADRITRFQLLTLEGIFKSEQINIDWHSLVNFKHPELVKRNPKMHWIDILTLSKQSCEEFINWFQKSQIDIKKSIDIFFKMIADEKFKNENSGGISFYEIQLLHEMTLENYAITLGLSHAYPMLPFDTEELKLIILPDTDLGYPFTFLDFLFTYWQNPNLGEKLSFTPFYLKVNAFLENYYNNHVAEPRFGKAFFNALKKAYIDLKPVRNYVH